MLEDVGHMPMEEAPAESLAVALPFLERVTAPQADSLDSGLY